LLASEKDRAENVMIVDLMRNDLGTLVPHRFGARGKTLRPGELCQRAPPGQRDERRPSTRTPVRSTCSHDCFPGGSITGAPKIRAMQIIDELEPDPRSVYCGAIGYVSRHGAMDTSIAIRTLVCDGREVHAWGGGGIVVDSDCSTEYRETLTKIEPLLDGLRAASAAPGIRSSLMLAARNASFSAS
jgi:para-aminobenzoate synthetase component 1